MELVFSVGKMVIMTLLIAVPLIVVLIRRWRNGSIMVPHSAIMFSAVLLPMAYLLSTLFAANKTTALLGLNFNTDSFIVILLGFSVLTLTALLGVRKGFVERVTKVVIWLCSFVVIVFVVQMAVQFLSVESLAWISLLQPAGSWLNVASLAGLMTIFFTASSRLKGDTVIYYDVKKIVIVVALMLFLGVFTNTLLLFTLIAMIAVAKIALVMHAGGWSKSALRHGAIVLPGIVLVLSGFFIVDSLVLNAKVSNTLQGWTQISFVNVRPNWQGTLDVAKGTVTSGDMTAKLFGPGVGSFSQQWRMHKPLGVNNTQFWSTNFNNAVGFVPTSIITGGAVVFAAWVLFLFALAWGVLRSRGSVLGLMTLFIWLFVILNPVDTLVLLIAFVLAGALVAESARARTVPMVTYKLRGEGVHMIMAYLALPVLVASSLGALLVVAHRTAVNAYFVKASSAMLAGNMNETELILNKIKSFTDAAVVEQGYTKIALARLSLLLQESDKEGAGADTEALQAALSSVLSHAQRAIERDPQDPLNYIALGSISEQLISLKIEGSTESALAAYSQAAVLDPYNPSIPLAIARVYGLAEQKEQMTQALEASLRLKGNYIPALYQYGVLKLSEQDTQTAIQALGSVVQLNQDNANALYYLSAALVQEERIEEALIVMQRVLTLNPENEDVKQILGGLQQRIVAKNTAQSDISLEKSQ